MNLAVQHAECLKKGAQTSAGYIQHSDGALALPNATAQLNLIYLAEMISPGNSSSRSPSLHSEQQT